MCAIRPLLYPKEKRILFILADARFIFKHSKQSFVASAAEELPWLFSHPVSLFWCSVSLALLWHCQKTSAHYICFLKRLRFRESERQSEPNSTDCGCYCRVMPTLGGNPRRRVHSARALEGELDVCHADSGCHVFINLWQQRTDLTLFSTFLFFCRIIYFSLDWLNPVATDFCVEI